MAARVADQTGFLQLERPLGHALPTHAQHVGDQLLRHDQFVVPQTIQAQQQPTAQLLVKRVVAIANRRLRHLRDQRLRVPQQQVQHWRSVELFLDRPGLQLETMAGALNHRAAGRGFTAHEQRDSHQPFVPHHGDLGRRAVLHHVEERND